MELGAVTLADALIADMTLGSTVAGSARGNEAVSSEIAEPASVSGGTSAGDGTDPPITFCAPAILAQAQNIGFVPMPKAQSNLTIDAACLRLTGQVTLSDQVAMVFGEAEAKA